jgi:hypothetical protein
VKLVLISLLLCSSISSFANTFKKNCTTNIGLNLAIDFSSDSQTGTLDISHLEFVSNGNTQEELFDIKGNFDGVGEMGESSFSYSLQSSSYQSLILLLPEWQALIVSRTGKTIKTNRCN